MRSVVRGAERWLWALLVIGTLLLTPAIYAGNQVMGEIQFEGKSKVERTSGVWVDGGYVGYLKELKGSKKVLLLPGEHVITVRQDGYQDFTERVNVQPGQKQVVRVAMAKAPTGVMPAIKSTVKLEVNPPRAAVFVDGLFVGHVAEFEGVGRGMLVAPGPHKIRVSLPGYQTFETEVNALPKQKVEVKTNLLKTNNDSAVADPLMKPGSEKAMPIPAPEPLPKAAGKDTTPIPPPDPLPPPRR
jgi:PEGA domain